MNRHIKYVLILALGLFYTSCDDYLSVELQDQMTIDEVFQKRKTTENYLAQIYSFLPKEYNPLGEDGSSTPCSDEAAFSWISIHYVSFINGTWGPTTWDYQIWAERYKGISQSAIFLANVDKCLELDQNAKEVMKAEVKFLRAYLYFTLVRRFGPVFIWGDRAPDSLIKPEEIDRHPLDANFEFIISEFDKAIEVLPETYNDEAWIGRITKGAARAAKSRVTLYAARPLFNGCDLYKGLKNKDEEFLFPQSPDPQKWEAAAKAAKAVIDMPRYSLYEDNKETDPMRKAIKSYMGVIFEKWNSEVIWGVHTSAYQYNVRVGPPRVVKEGYGGFCPSTKLVDTYPMAESGRFPITGYDATGKPIVDPKSGYVGEGFTNPWTHPLDNFASINAHNSCIGRDARYYASVLANGMYWINTYKGQKLVTFYTGGTSNYSTSQDCVKSGFIWRRMTEPANNMEEDKWGTFCWPNYRLGEIYLNYAEACNEKPNRDEAEALKYINKIRNRSGLNNIEVAYPEVKGNQILLRELIQKERMVELAFENHRYYDIRTWMIADKEYNGPRWTLNLLATNYEDSWERTDQVFRDRMVFEPKHYLFPIHQDQLKEMKNITQNYGW